MQATSTDNVIIAAARRLLERTDDASALDRQVIAMTLEGITTKGRCTAYQAGFLMRSVERHWRSLGVSRGALETCLADVSWDASARGDHR